MEHRYLECDCEDGEHVLRLSWFDDDRDMIYVCCYIKKERWYKRIWVGIKYIFGYRSKYGEFGEFLWRPNTVRKLVEFGKEFLDDQNRLPKE